VNKLQENNNKNGKERFNGTPKTQSLWVVVKRRGKTLLRFLPFTHVKQNGDFLASVRLPSSENGRT
jgi:hypothetical protein